MENEDKLTEVALNNLARHQFIRRMLSEVAMDMKVQTLIGGNPIEFPLMIQKEINNIIEKWEKAKKI